MREAMLKKEEKLAALFKKTSKIMSDYEKETEEMIQQLHKARDEQVFAANISHQATLRLKNVKIFIGLFGQFL